MNNLLKHQKGDIERNKKKNKENLLKTLNYHLKKDKRKSEVLGLTRLGLVEVARRREKNSINEYYLEECSVCEGNSFIKSINYIMDDLEKEISRIKSHTCYNQITVEFNPMVLSKIKANKMDLINKIKNKYGMNIWLKEDEKLSYEKYKIIFIS